MTFKLTENNSYIKDTAVQTYIFNDLAFSTSRFEDDNDRSDCIEILEKAAPESVDMIFADPPYMLSNGGISCQAGKSQEIKNRKDIHETQNKIVIKDGTQMMETVISYNYETLLLCTSLAQENLYNDKCVNEYGFKINRPSEFIDILTRALVTKGIKICEILRGPCVYNNKQITIDATGSNVINNFLNQNEQGRIDFDPTTKYISEQAQNHILMNKPTSYSFENEYRFIWKLYSSISKNNVSDDVQVNTDGSIIVRVPELIPFCERL